MTPFEYPPPAGSVLTGGTCRDAPGVMLSPADPPDDPAGDLAAAIDTGAWPLVPDWHTSIGGGPHVTPEAAERVEADAIYLRRVGRLEAR